MFCRNLWAPCALRDGAWNRFAAILRDARGVTAIEFAIIAPFFLSLMMGMIKFAIAMGSYLVLTNASAQGALTLAFGRGTSTPYSTMTQAVTQAASNLTSSNITIVARINGTVCSSDSACSSALTAGQPASVTLSYPCDLTVLGVNFKPDGCTLSAQAAQMIQ